MKAIQIAEPGKVKIIEQEKPKRTKQEALLKLLYGGICGSDLGSYKGTFAYFSYPRVPGHEFSAEIIEIGKNDRGLKPGMVVTCNPYFNCGSCYSCKKGRVNACMHNETMGVQREGAFSEYITMPIDRIYDGKGLDPKKLAMIEPFCIGLHGVRQADVKAGDKVLIVGTGTIGMMAALSAQKSGAEVYVSDIAPEKLIFAMGFGFKGSILNDSPEHFQQQVAEATNGNGFDVVLEAVGSPSTFLDCVEAASFGGRMVLIGVGKQNVDFNFTLIQKKELQIRGSRNALKQDFLSLIDLVIQEDIPLEKFITNTYAFEDASKAFQDFAKSPGKTMKILLDFTKGGNIHD